MSIGELIVPTLVISLIATQTLRHIQHPIARNHCFTSSTHTITYLLSCLWLCHLKFNRSSLHNENETHLQSRAPLVSQSLGLVATLVPYWNFPAESCLSRSNICEATHTFTYCTTKTKRRIPATALYLSCRPFSSLPLPVFLHNNLTMKTLTAEASVADRKPSKSFWKELFELELFSDTTFTYGKHHKFQLHSQPLMSKSTWFAEQFRTKSDRFELTMDCFDPQTITIFRRTDWASCSAHKATESCAFVSFVKKALAFCYLEEYKWEYTGKNAQSMCKAQVVMYLVGTTFGIDSLRDICVKQYSKIMVDLREDPIFPYFVNIVYDLTTLEDDPLRMEARKQAEAFAADEFIHIQKKFLQEVTWSRTAQAMPKAAQELVLLSFDRDQFKTKIESMQTDPGATRPPTFGLCSRCTEPLQENEVQLCGLCKGTSWKSLSMQFPTHRNIGISMTFWECQGCLQVWNSDYPKKHNRILAKCCSCVASEEKTQSGRKILLKWRCKCSTEWRAFSQRNQAQIDLDQCICCTE
ncbi:hypothetical protein ACN47E_004428 [Coniothyrium glycines]